MQMQLKDSQICRPIFNLFLFALKLNILWIFWWSLIIIFRFYWKRWSCVGLCATDRTVRWSHNSLVAARSEWIIRRYVHSKNQLLNLFKLMKRRTGRQKMPRSFRKCTWTSTSDLSCCGQTDMENCISIWRMRRKKEETKRSLNSTIIFHWYFERISLFIYYS